MNGFVYIWPEHAHALPRASRCLLGWHRLHIHGEGGPMPQEAIACVEEWLLLKGHVEESFLVALCFDSYLRTGEAFALRVEDVVVLRDASGAVLDVTLRIGVAERGKSAKTGMRQGVRVDPPHVVDLLVSRLSDKAGPKEKLIHSHPSTFSQRWRDALPEH